jgi:hypothetical protein
VPEPFGTDAAREHAEGDDPDQRSRDASCQRAADVLRKLGSK